MSPAILIGERCHYRNHDVSPASIINFPGGARICVDCHHKHLEALQSLSTGSLKECSECGRTWEQLREAGLGGDNGDVKMLCHYEAGLYRLLCPPCSAAYERLRRDLYGATEYGKRKGI